MPEHTPCYTHSLKPHPIVAAMASDGVAHIPRFRTVEDERDLSMELMIDAGVPDEAHCSKDEDEVDADEAKAPPQEQNEESKDLELIVTFLEQMKPSTPELLRRFQLGWSCLAWDRSFGLGTTETCSLEPSHQVIR